jgi:hypothetical protein
MEDPGLDIDDETLLQLGLTIPIPDLLCLCQTNKRLSCFCKSNRLWRTRLTQDFPGVDYHDFADNPLHAYIILHTAKTIVDGSARTTIENRGRYITIDDEPTGQYDADNVIVVVTFLPGMTREYCDFMVGRSLVDGTAPGPRTSGWAHFSLKRNVVDVARFVLDLIKTMGFDYTDITISIRG